MFAEALIYYDQLLVNPTTQPQFAALLEWAQNQSSLDKLLGLAKDGVIKIYDYSFATSAVQQGASYAIMNIQDEVQAQPNTFDRRFLYHDSVEALFPKARHRRKIYEAFHGIR